MGSPKDTDPLADAWPVAGSTNSHAALSMVEMVPVTIKGLASVLLARDALKQNSSLQVTPTGVVSCVIGFVDVAFTSGLQTPIASGVLGLGR